MRNRIASIVVLASLIVGQWLATISMGGCPHDDQAHLHVNSLLGQQSTCCSCRLHHDEIDESQTAHANESDHPHHDADAVYVAPEVLGPPKRLAINHADHTVMSPFALVQDRSITTSFSVINPPLVHTPQRRSGTTFTLRI